VTRVARPLLVVAVLAAGCVLPHPSSKKAETALFPEGAFAPSNVPDGGCGAARRRFADAETRRRVGPPAIPGEDGSTWTVAVSDRMSLFEVVAFEVDALDDPSRDDPVLVSTGRALDLGAAPIMLGSSPEIRATVLLRVRAGGGLFDDLSYCVERSVAVRLRPAAREATLVLEDGGGPDWTFPTMRFEPETDEVRGCGDACFDGPRFDEHIEPPVE
jgi:hypothetical protein